MMKWSFSKLFVGLCTAPATSVDSMLSIISGGSFDFFLRVIDAILLYKLSFFFSSALVLAPWNKKEAVSLKRGLN